MLITLTANKVDPKLVAFKPRQVVLRNPSMKHSNGKDNNGSSDGTISLNTDQKFLLHQSIAAYLESSGFGKTLKKFRSEAKLETDGLKGSLIDLEVMCLKYLENCKDAKLPVNNQKEQDENSDKISPKDVESGFIANIEYVSKKKKRRSDKSDSHAVDDQPEATESCKNSKNPEDMTNDIGPESNVKSKKEEKKKKSDSLSQGTELPKTLADTNESKWENPDNKDKKRKKNRSSSESLVDCKEQHLGAIEAKIKDSVPPNGKTVGDSETENKAMNKKKKKHMLISDSLGDDDGEDKSKDVKDQSKKLDEDTAEKKDSKKRKRLVSEEDILQLADKNSVEEPKRRKIGSSKKSKESEHSAKLNVSVGILKDDNKENTGKGVQDGGNEFQKTSSGQINGQANGNLEKTGEKSSAHKSLKKHDDSLEPRTVKAFQRVKIDEVEFVDERLKDNSYWGKGGAESGYGAKAEEVLGQVRGRNFRHEKTKKKRGSYRGGQIDIQSHSIKFNYSDDE
ncbi:nucleolar and coiled-body phosphoprotein 1 [Quillaja saponaria]|uniref:Nucleolar and coiled-body phosphoprotein 1 n=1 Tax=Quillaja saponaria TaxID=32244 RepID=A0AAD7LDL0_QUISA|nr:nucleolar and coiled-body phosphoprotein 1 [Quillaja saponaria]